jgi:triacylglycerol lipase
VVLLVPGLLGFGKFGDPPSLSYFDQVALRLAEFTGWAADRFLVHTPPPTGALEWRVKSLFEAVTTLIAKGLPSGEPVDRIHLIGHSTGGCDIRLLLNERYSWPDPPSPVARAELCDRVGAAITLSAPLQGTPIARRLRGTMEAAIPVLYVLSILGKQPMRLSLRTKIAGASLMILHLVAERSAQEGLRALVEAVLPPDAKDEVVAYLDKIVTDHELIHNLTAFAMSRLNAVIRGGDQRPLRCYVTVAPAPGVSGLLTAGLPLRALQTAAYAFAYWNTLPDPGEMPSELGPFPQGRWIESAGHEALAYEGTSDGVVTSSSQTVDGTAAGIVAGDHLDVVGHFASKRFPGVTVFRSGSGFDDARFDALWKAIASDVVRASASKSVTDDAGLSAGEGFPVEA